MNTWVKAAIASIAVWVCGFGALYAFHLVLSPISGLPGLFDFASATWGDGLALPIMAGALVYAIDRLSAVQRERVVALVVGMLGGLLGAATQVMWLLDDAPRGNWTFPRPHHFNAAGWYHAGFLTLMSAAAAILWSLALLRLAGRAVDGKRSRMPAVVAVGVAFVAAAAFAVLLAVDAAPNPATASSAATTAATAAGGLALVVALLVTVAYAVRRRTSSANPASARRR